jgi:hypothetical protein
VVLVHGRSLEFAVLNHTDGIQFRVFLDGLIEDVAHHSLLCPSVTDGAADAVEVSQAVILRGVVLIEWNLYILPLSYIVTEIKEFIVEVMLMPSLWALYSFV